MAAAAGAGQLVGGLTPATIGGPGGRQRLVLGTAAGSGIALALLAAQLELPVALLLLPCVSGLMIFSAGLLMANVQRAVPDHLRSRLVGVQGLILEGALPLGTLAPGSIATTFGVAGMLAGSGLLLAAACAVIGARVPLFSPASAPGSARPGY